MSMQLCLRDAFDRKQKYKSSKFLSFFSFFFFFLISYSIISNSDTERIKNSVKKGKRDKKAFSNRSAGTRAWKFNDLVPPNFSKSVHVHVHARAYGDINFLSSSSKT